MIKLQTVNPPRQKSLFLSGNPSTKVFRELYNGIDSKIRFIYFLQYHTRPSRIWTLHR